MENNTLGKVKQGGKYEIGLIVVSLAILCAFVVMMVLKPDSMLFGVNTVFNKIIAVFGGFLEVFTLGTLCIAVYLGVSKFGNIKFGEEEPEYKMFSYVAMMTLAALASAALYWSYTEWAFYYAAPGLGMEAGSLEALESSLAYQLFHWGVSGQCVYVGIGAAMAYAIYIRKVPILQTSHICGTMMGEIKGKSIIGKFIDFAVIFGIVGGLGCTLGLAVPLTGGALTQVFGIESTFLVKVLIVLVIALVFTFTSFIGTDKGMKRIANFSAALCILFLVFVFFAGPTTYIIKNTVNSFGWMIQMFPRMSLFTDPVAQTGFPEAWTMYFQAFYLNYAALMGIFIAKISKGRKMRELVWATLIGISAGGWFLFCINGSFSQWTHINGLTDIVGLVNGGSPEAGIFDVIELLPGGAILLPLIILLIIVGFVASSLDSASLALAQTTTKVYEKDGNVNRWMRVFWCIVLTLVPLSIMFAGAEFAVLKTISIIVSVPFMIIVLFMEVNLLRWLSQDRKAGKLETFGIKSKAD